MSFRLKKNNPRWKYGNAVLKSTEKGKQVYNFIGTMTVQWSVSQSLIHVEFTYNNMKGCMCGKEKMLGSIIIYEVVKVLI